MVRADSDSSLNSRKQEAFVAKYADVPNSVLDPVKDMDPELAVTM